MTNDYVAFRDDLFRTCGMFTWFLGIDGESFPKVMAILGASASFVNGDSDHNLSYVQNLFGRCYGDMANHSGFFERTGDAGRHSKDFALHVMYTLGLIAGTARAIGIEAKPEAQDFFCKIGTMMDLDLDEAMDSYRQGAFLGHDLVYFGRLFSGTLPEQTTS